MTAQEAKFKRQMLESLKAKLADGAKRPTALLATYRATIQRLEAELA